MSLISSPTMKKSPGAGREDHLHRGLPFFPWVIINRDDAPIVSRIEDLKGKKVALEQGYVIKDRIVSEYPQIAVVEFAKTVEALRAVATGGADACPSAISPSPPISSKTMA